MISIIILSYNTQAYTINLLKSLDLFCPALHDGSAHVYLRDQGSQDGSVKMLSRYLKDHHNWLTVYFGTCNQNIHGALNGIIEMIPRESDIIWLSSDCEITPGWLEGMIKFAELQLRAGIISGMTVATDHQNPHQVNINHGGTVEDVMCSHRLGRIGYDSDLCHPARMVWVTGANMFIRRQCFDEVGGFDTEYQLYWGDRDLCMQANAKGWEVWYNPWSVAYHSAGATIRTMRPKMEPGTFDNANQKDRHYFDSKWRQYNVYGNGAIISKPLIPINPHGYWETTDNTGHGFDLPLCNAIRDFLIAEKAITVVDFGCGLGDYVRLLKVYGLNAKGYDGNPNTVNLAQGAGEVLDLSQPINGGWQFDCTISLEVGEHIPKEFEQTFLDNLTNHTKRIIILSWAVPGQEGDGHVNNQNNDYIIAEMLKRDWLFDLDPSQELRDNSNFEWFKDTVMVFRRMG